jgi:hypothetical protein
VTSGPNYDDPPLLSVGPDPTRLGAEGVRSSRDQRLSVSPEVSVRPPLNTDVTSLTLSSESAAIIAKAWVVSGHLQLQ